MSIAVVLISPCLTGGASGSWFPPLQQISGVSPERLVKHGDIGTTAMDISFSILFEFYFIFSLYFEALLYYLYRSFHAYVIRASKRQRHC